MSYLSQEFRHLMNDVQPLSKGQKRADIRNTQQTPSEAQLARRKNAETTDNETNFLSDDFVELIGAHDPVEYRRNGIQIGVLEKLRHGGYPAEARLHLIKMPLNECRREVFRFILDAYQHGLRSLLLVHGRGREDDSRANILRSYVIKWLAQFEEVQAYASAPAQQGGLGATLVMLRKSERARDTNREQQQKRRG